MSWNWGGRNPDNADYVARTPEDRGVGGVYEPIGGQGQTYNTPRSGGGGSNVSSDGIAAWRRLEEPFLHYLGQFRNQNPNFRPLEYYPESTVANLTPQMQHGLDTMWRAGYQAQQIGDNAYNFGKRQMDVGSPEAINWSLNQGQAAADTAGSGMRHYANVGHDQANQSYYGAVGAAGGAGSLDETGMNNRAFSSIFANDTLQGEIDRVSEDIMRNTAENVIPGLATSAVGAGNPYSTRTQHSYDTAMRDTREAIADTAAQLRFQNFSAARDATLAQQAQNQATELSRRGLAQQGYLQGGQLRQSAVNTGVNAYQGAGQMETGAHQFAAGMQNQLGQQGVQNQLAAGQQYAAGAGHFQNVGQFYQNYAQAQRNDQVNRFQFNQMSPFQTMQMYTQSLSPPAGMPFSFSSRGGGSNAAGMSTLPGIMMGAASLYDAWNQ